MSRWTGAVFVAPLVATAMFVLGSYHAPWRGEWNWTIDTITGTTVLTAPLTAALAAHLAVGQSRLADLTRATPRGWLVPYRVWLQAGLISLCVYALTAAGALLITLVSTHGGPLTASAILMGVPVLGVGAAAGAAAGHWLPYRMTTTLAAPAFFLFGSFGPHPAAELLRHGPATGSLAGLRFDPAVWCAQASALLAVLVCLAAVMQPWEQPSYRVIKVSCTGLAVVAMAASLFVAQRVGTERFLASHERPTACREGSPRICLAPSNTRNLEATASAMGEVADVLREGGVRLPASYEQLLPGYRPLPSAGMITRLIEPGEPDVVRAATANVLVPSPCQAWTDPRQPPPEGVYQAQSLLTEWIVLRSGGSPTGLEPQAEHWLDEQREGRTSDWVTQTFEALEKCHLEDIALPWSASGP